MSVRGTALLAAVLLGLVAYLRFTAPGATRNAGEEATVEPALLPVGARAVARLELSDDAGRLTLVQRNGAWADADGRAWPAGVPTGLLEALATLRPITMVDAAPDDVRDYRLGPDAVRLRVVDHTDRAVLSLEIGGRNPAWTGVYARREGDPGVFLVGALLQWEIDKLRNTARSVSDP